MSAEPDDVTHEAPQRQLHQDVLHAPATTGEAPQRSPLEQLASDVGNRGFTSIVARMTDGEGILDGGTVHPAVQAAIASMAGRGRPLDSGLADRLAPTHGDLSDARVHTGPDADRLARSVSATAFTVGRDVFFSRDAYKPQTADGFHLAAHELAHVVQQRNQPSTGPLTVSMPGDALEREADGFAHAAG